MIATIKKFHAFMKPRYLPWAIILLGVFLRLRKYTFNRAIWLDEAMLSLNILERPFGDLFKPLDYNQVAPPGFLILVKSAVQLFGDSEFVLRLIPFLASVLALMLFYTITRRLTGPLAANIALVIFAISDPLVEFASEVKPYSSDIAIASALLLFALNMNPAGRSGVRSILYGILGALSVWFSLPAVFILTGIAASEVVQYIVEKRWASIRRSLPVYLLWAASFTAYYLIIGRSAGTSHLTEYWDDAFMPIWPLNFGILDWLLTAYIGVFKDVLELTIYSGTAMIFLVGCVSILSEKRWHLATMSFPILVVLGASAVQLYPFKGRLLLFLAPSVLIVLGEGAASIVGGMKRYRYLMGLILVSLLVFQPLKDARWRVVHPFAREEIRPLVNHLQEAYRDGDGLYLYYNAQYAYSYYSDQLDLEIPESIIGAEARDEPEKYIQEVEKLRPNERVWLLFSHSYPTGPYGNEEAYITRQLDCMGRMIEEHRELGASLYLYDLSAEAALESATNNSACEE